MGDMLRRWWPWIKLLLAVAIIGGVGWQFVKLLRDPALWAADIELRPGWLAACMGLYALAFAFPGFYWWRLLGAMGTRPTLVGAARAYYVGHLGKYVPGKAWALVMRATLIHPYGVRSSAAVATAIYETLTFMAAGALVAVVLLTVHALEESDRWQALGLLLLAGIPIIPGVFNRIVERMAGLARKAAQRQGGTEQEVKSLPRLGVATLFSGLGLTAFGWAAMGLSLWTILQGVLPEPPAWSWEAWGRYTAFITLAYVAGFLALPAPGGLGVREIILLRLLTPELSLSMGAERAAALAALAVALLRLLWTFAEVIMAGTTFLAPLVLAAKPQAELSTAPLTTDH